MGSECSHNLEGSLRVQLLSLQGICLRDKEELWSSGMAYVILTCTDWSGSLESYRSDPVKVSVGAASFDDGAPGGRGLAQHAALTFNASFTFSRISPGGVMGMWLICQSALFQRTIAKASLQLNAIRHQMDGGLDIEHNIQWQSLNRKQSGSRGSITLQACWVSTEQEQQELQLLQMQVSPGT
jgi:hypothetical protein